MEEKINFKLRDWVFQDKDFGVVQYLLFIEDGEILPVEEKDLPVKLPDIQKFNESSTALNNIAGWKETLCPKLA